ncbi:MAG: hypothetical protein WA510_27035 [Acidobacteriaceae bacterium]
MAQICKLRIRCGQQDDLTTDPQYFIAANTLNRRSVGAALVRVAGEIEGYILFYEYYFFGIRLGLARLGDHLGEGFVVGPEPLRTQLVHLAANALLKSRRFHGITISIRAPVDDCIRTMGPEGKHAIFSRREIQYKLPLAETYQAMLASFGQRTRRSLAGKRRQLEQSMNVVFEPSLNPETALEAMLSLRTKSLPDRDAAFFHARRSLRLQNPEFFCMGMRTPQGDWLSILSGWRRNRVTYIDLQMNDMNYKKESLSAVMRAFTLEYEIARRQELLYFVGGCSLLLRRYCNTGEECTDIFLSLPGLRTQLFRAFVPPAIMKSILERKNPTFSQIQA